MVQHERDGHTPKIAGCPVCELAFAQQKGAFKGGVHGKVRASTLNVDLIDWGVRDNNGNRYHCPGAIVDTSFPSVRAQAGKQGAVTTQNVMSIINEVEALSDPGGVDGYKVCRIHSDQGSEFKLLGDACGDRGITITTGEADRHTDGTVIEGTNKVIEYTCTALALTAVEDNKVAIQLHGELANHAVDIIRLRSRTKWQHDMNMSCWTEQTLTDAPMHLKNTYRFGSLAYGYLKKSDRDNKLSARAYVGIFVGWDKAVVGAIRVVPFLLKPDTGAIMLCKTKVTKSFRVFDG